MKTLKYLLTAVCLLALAPIHAQASSVVYEKADSQKVVKFLKEAQRQMKTQKAMADPGQLSLFFAHQLLGLPYVAHTLEGFDEERLVVNLRQLDCTTLVENSVVLTLCARQGMTSFADFLKMLERVRYRQGRRTDYTSRLHYFTDWILDKTDMRLVTEIQQKTVPFTAVQQIQVGYMSSHPSAYDALKRHAELIQKIAKQEKDLNSHRFRYIPKNRLGDSRQLRDCVKNGDIIAIVTNKKGLDIAHVGLAEWQKDGLHLLNASSIHKKVVVEPMTLSTYMKKHKSFLGIRVVRLH